MNDKDLWKIIDSPDSHPTETEAAFISLYSRIDTDVHALIAATRRNHPELMESFLSQFESMKRFIETDDTT